MPASSAAETIVLPYNDLSAVEAAFAARGPEIACVITEAAAGNMGVVPPVDGFTEGLLRIAHESRGARCQRRGVTTGAPVLAERVVRARGSVCVGSASTCSPSAR